MAREVQNGKAVLWGINNSGTAIAIEGYASFILKDLKLDHKFKLTAIEDEDDFDASLIAANEHMETSITWTPSGDTRTAIADELAFLSPLAKVTLSNFQIAILNGDWIYIGDSSITISSQAGKMSLKIRKYMDEGQNDSLTTTVSG